MSYSVTMAPGNYYLGDPSYVLHPEGWQSLRRLTHDFENSIGEIRGHAMCAFGTGMGDGVFTDNFGNQIAVDSGFIGLIPERVLIEAGIAAPRLSATVTFQNSVTCTTDGRGHLTFGPFQIDTSWPEMVEVVEEYAPAYYDDGQDSGYYDDGDTFVEDVVEEFVGEYDPWSN